MSKNEKSNNLVHKRSAGSGGTSTYLLVSNKRNSNKIRKSNRCGNYAVEGEKNGEGHVIRVFCRKYGCEICGKMKAYSVRKTIEKAIQEHQLNTFLTLTIDPRSCSPKESPKYIQKVWNIFLTKIRKEFDSVKYVRVIEFQKKTLNAHLHVLLNVYIPFDWINEKWREAGGGIVKIERARESARYICKYLTKELETEIYGKFRRVSSSRGIRFTQDRVSKGYQFSNSNYNNLKFQTLGKFKITNKFGDLETGFTFPKPGARDDR